MFRFAKDEADEFCVVLCRSGGMIVCLLDRSDYQIHRDLE
jgi:hypothetical protein